MRRVLFTTTARVHVERERTWWFENRDRRDVFASDLEGAIGLLSVLPGIGTVYRCGLPGVRRLYLRHIACHVYYTFDEDRVLILALWSARRERGPDLS